jgi:hypothetical protein
MQAMETTPTVHGEPEETEAVTGRPINITRETVVVDLELPEPEIIEAATE